MPHSLEDILAMRPLVFDGAMGTQLAAAGAPGGCNEELCLSAPKLVVDIHRAYLAAGADIVITNTFGASRVVLADHGLAGKAAEINRAAVRIAREAADAVASAERPRFVAGEVGPTSKLPTLGHICFDELSSAYREQVELFLDGGVDLILIATCQDPLQAKAALSAAEEAFVVRGRRLPVVVSVTMEPSGTMLLGTELAAVLAAIAPYRPFAFGINCATGPDSMEEHLQELAVESPFPIACQPNAGIPENRDGRPFYPLGPDAFARQMADFVDRFHLSLVGGCCGTTPGHIRALVKALDEGRKTTPHLSSPLRGEGQSDSVPSPPRGEGQGEGWRPSVSSLYSAVALDQEPRPFLVAEQTNVNGSKAFRELLLAGDWDAMAEAGQRAAEASHALDVCVAFAGRDEASDLVQIVRRLAVRARAALMIDSTNPDAIGAALALVPGRAIVNSINLEDGGAKARRIIALARRFGAAVVALSIDESGMARKAEEKLAVAKRLAALASEGGLRIEDLLFDPLTFTLASGDPTLRDAGRETLEGLRAIKREIPGARTILGVSNISFGLPAAGRKFLTSVFLKCALDAGLDAAIINPMRIAPLDAIPGEEAALCRRLIMNDAAAGDPLSALIVHLQKRGRSGERGEEARGSATPAEELGSHIVEGRTAGLGAAVEKVLGLMPAERIVGDILLPAMQEVGRRFGEGRLPLPFVLASAEAMRAAIDLVAPHLASAGHRHKGTIILATVRGDVHDIGKNLVDAILSNNGFRVVNLGIRQPAAAIAEAVKKHGADAIGVSGLLVSSTEVMREDLEFFRDRGLSLPVLCGGAALTPSFVRDVLAKAYGREVVYCADAFAGLVAMQEITTPHPPLSPEGRG